MRGYIRFFPFNQRNNDGSHQSINYLFPSLYLYMKISFIKRKKDHEYVIVVVHIRISSPTFFFLDCNSFINFLPQFIINDCKKKESLIILERE